MRPGLSGVPYAVVSDAAAKAARETPICPNGAVCYSPSHLRDAYDFPNGRGAATGAGQTIIVVTAYGSATIEDDLAQFDAENGLSSPPSFTIVEQQAPVDGAQGSGDLLHWQVETSLDVEYAHAMAPGASIVLAVAASDDTRDLRQVQLEVLPKYPGSIVSESFGLDEDILFGGEPETPAALDALYLAHVQGGGTIVAASGDLGASGLGGLFGLARPIAGYPASSPLVLGVGGTMGSPFPQGLWNAGRYGGEQAWNELISLSPGAGAGGGAPSIVYPAPPWQVALTHSSTRAEPDVSYNAAFNGGEVIVVTTPFGRHAVVGGTSAGAPQWAAIVALANELRGRQGRPPLGLATPQLWLLAQDRNAYRQDFHDITAGSNALGGPDSGLPGFDAGPGYDYATGLGTPDVARLIKDLAGRDSVHLRLDDLLGPKQH
jgi:subtilase family serine protease